MRVCVRVQGTSLVLGPLNYLFVHTFNSGKFCLGVFDNGRAGECLPAGPNAAAIWGPAA